MRGILYGVGVGLGDLELMTLKAVRLIKENDIITISFFLLYFYYLLSILFLFPF